ncbi:MAG: hypothetical protein ACE15C_01970 [Phycisphaerae bacterium]
MKLLRTIIVLLPMLFAGCATIVWKATEAGTGAIASQEKPGQNPAVQAVEQGARKTNEGMRKVDEAEKQALHKLTDRFAK